MSTVCRRLHSLFKQTPKPIAAAAGKTSPLSSAAAIAISGEKKLQNLVDKFKKSTKYPSFRRRRDAYEAAVRRLAAAGKFSDVEDIIEHQKSYPDIANERFVSRLITLYGQAGMAEHALKLFDEMPELKCERTVLSFNALLSAYVKAKKFDQISELFREIPEKFSIEPDVVSYNVVVKALCEMGSLDSAVLAIDRMDQSGVEPNLITYNTVLDALAKNKRLSLLEKVWGLMERRNVVPNVRSFNSGLHALVVENRFLDAFQRLEEMEKNGLKPDTFTYNVFIKGYVNQGNLEEAKKWYEKMGENGCNPDHVTMLSLIPPACDNGELEFAIELCKKSIELKVFVHESTLQRVVDKLVELSKVEEAKELVALGKKCSFRYNLNC